MPRRSSRAHRAGHEAVVLQARDDARQRALAEVDGARRAPACGARPLAGREALEHLVLADAEAVLVQRALEGAHRARVAVEQLAPLVDERASLVAVTTRAIVPSACNIMRSHLMHGIRCVCMYSVWHALPLPSLRDAACSSSCAASSSSTDSTSRWSASRSRRSRPTSASPPRSCSGSSPATCSATAACCCSAAARPTCSAAAALIIALGVFTVASAARRARQRRHAAHRHPLPQGRRAPRSPRPPASRSSRRPSPKARRATGRWHLHRAGASGFSLGLVLGGLLTELGWRWTFLLPVPIALALLCLAPRLIPHDRPRRSRRRRYDIPGAVTLTAGMLLLVRTIVEAPAPGLDLGRHDRRVRRERRAAGGVRGDRAARAAAARAARHPALGPARARQPRRWRRVRRLRRLPVRRDAVPADAPAGRRWRPRSRSCPPACSSPSARRGSGRCVDRFGAPRVIAVGALSFAAGYALAPAGSTRRRPTCSNCCRRCCCSASASRCASRR